MYGIVWYYMVVYGLVLYCIVLEVWCLTAGAVPCPELGGRGGRLRVSRRSPGNHPQQRHSAAAQPAPPHSVRSGPRVSRQRGGGGEGGADQTFKHGKWCLGGGLNKAHVEGGGGGAGLNKAHWGGGRVKQSRW